MKLSNLQKRLAVSSIYQPAEDTFFLADNIENEKGETALDIGTGSGFLAKILSNSFNLVIGTDKNINSLRQQYEPIRNRKEIEKILYQCNCTINQCPIILKTDIISKFIRLAPGDLCKITRKSSKCGTYPFYRVCK